MVTELYNTSWMQNGTNIYQIYLGVSNSVQDHYMIGNLFIISLFVIMYVTYVYRSDAKVALIISSFFCTLISIIMVFLGFIPIGTPSILVALFAISLVIYFFTER